MSAFGVGILVGWGFLIFLWLFRLQRYELYAEKLWASLWITGRALLRLGMGVFGVLTWESLHAPEPAPFYAIIVDAGCKEAWRLSEELGQRLLRKNYRTALLAVKEGEAFWAIPPTTDSTAFFRLMDELNKAAIPSDAAPATLRAIRRQLLPYRERVVQVIWIGRFSSDVGDRLPACSNEPPSELSIKSPPFPTWKGYGMAFILCALLLLLGDGYLYVFRKHLPLRPAQELWR